MVDELFEVFEELFERRSKKKRKGEGGGSEPRKATAPAAPPVFCVECGVRNEGNARFCMECGALLPSPGEELRCLSCNTQLPLKAKFCPRCGAKAAV